MKIIQKDEKNDKKYYCFLYYYCRNNPIQITILFGINFI